MIDDIVYAFENNFKRLKNLIDLYESLSSGRGRKSTQELDLLRATTVLAHATLEDYLRSLLAWRLPLADKDKLKRVPLRGISDSNRSTKFELSDLVEFRGQTVDEVIELSVKEYLGMQSYNDTNDIVAALSTISVDITKEIRSTFSSLDEMIRRRHNIVHRADRDEKSGKGNHQIKSINSNQVKAWKLTIDTFATEVNKNFK